LKKTCVSEIQIEAYFLRAQALSGFGRTDMAKQLPAIVLHEDLNHAVAVDLLQNRAVGASGSFLVYGGICLAGAALIFFAVA
jgi:hypothetical protein